MKGVYMYNGEYVSSHSEVVGSGKESWKELEAGGVQARDDKGLHKVVVVRKGQENSFES